MRDAPKTPALPLRVLLLCLLVSVVAAGVAYAVGDAITKTYQASGTIRVDVPTQAGIDDSNVTAANDLASQYAPLVAEDPVAALTAKRLGVSAQTLHNQLTGSTVSAENILQVTANGGSASEAESRAAAGVRAAEAYFIKLTSAANDKYVSSLQTRIRNTTVTGASASSSNAAAQVDNARAVAMFDADRDAAGNQPTFQIVNLTNSASVVSPKPKLYAVVAFVVVLLISLRLAFVAMKSRDL